jgi:hypothetical protein
MPSPVFTAAFGGERKDAARTAGAQDHRSAEHRVHLASADVERRDADRAPVLDQDLRREVLVVAHDAVVFQRRLEQRVEHVEAGLVRRVPRALGAHAAERAHRHAAVLLAAPRAAPVLELVELARGLFHEPLDRVLVRQIVGALDRVLGVQVEVVVVARDPGRPALGRDGVAPHRVQLRDAGDGELRVRLDGRDRGAQARAPAADQDDVVPKDLHAPSPIFGAHSTGFRLRTRVS